MSTFTSIVYLKKDQQQYALTLPCVIGKGAEGDLSAGVKAGAEGIEVNRLDLKLAWLAFDLGKVMAHQDQLILEPNPKLQYHGVELALKRGKNTLVIYQSTQLLDGDLLSIQRFYQDELHSLTLEVELVAKQDRLADDILAERPIKALAQYELAQQPEKLKSLYQESLALSHCKTLNQVLTQTTQSIFKLLPKASHCMIALREREVFSVAISQAKNQVAAFENPIQMSRTLIRRVLEKKSAFLIVNASEEFKQIESVIQAGIASTLCVPLWIEDEIQGVIQIDHRNVGGLFNAQDLELLLVFSNNISSSVYHQSLIQRLMYQEQRLKTELNYLQTKDQAQYGFIGEDEKTLKMLKSIDRVKDLKVPVLIQGETGTGKELIARALHEQSNRKEHLFIAQNCGALPEALLESELFGYVKGAFTGADRDKKGLFELAHEGTIFLDEIGEMPLSLQAKLLRVLQEGELWSVGSVKSKKVDIRVVSATHRDLLQMVKEGKFREDLYYRLNVYPIAVPPLRQRKSDIPLIAQAFLKKYNREFGMNIQGFSPLAMKALQLYAWPGNVRELQNEIQRAIIQCMDADMISVDDLSLQLVELLQSISTEVQAAPLAVANLPLSKEASFAVNENTIAKDELLLKIKVNQPLKENIEAIEKQIIIKVLEQTQYSKTKTASLLDLSREGLYKKMNKIGLDFSKQGEE